MVCFHLRSVHYTSCIIILQNSKPKGVMRSRFVTDTGYYDPLMQLRVAWTSQHSSVLPLLVVPQYITEYHYVDGLLPLLHVHFIV